MDWIFISFLIASLIHMLEEYFIPGGFMQIMRGFNPRFAPYVTLPMAVVINGMQLLVCLLVIWVGQNWLPLGLSVAVLLFINGWVHLLGCLRLRRYVPGMISGALLYIPLSILAWVLFLRSGQVSLPGGLLSVGLGILYQLVPIAYLGLASSLKHT